MQSDEARCEHPWHSVPFHDLDNPWTSMDFQHYADIGLFDGPYDAKNCPACGEAIHTVACSRCNRDALRVEPGESAELYENCICYWCNEELSDPAADYPKEPATRTITAKASWDAPKLPIPFTAAEPESDEYNRLSDLAMTAWEAIDDAGWFLPATIDIGNYTPGVMLTTGVGDRRSTVALTPDAARELATQLQAMAEHVEATERWASAPH